MQANTNVTHEQHGTTRLADGKVLVTGGVISKYPMNSVEIYDPASNTWARQRPAATGLPLPRPAHAVRRQAAVDGQQLIDPWHLAAVLEGFRLRMDDRLSAPSTAAPSSMPHGTPLTGISGW